MLSITGFRQTPENMENLGKLYILNTGKFREKRRGNFFFSPQLKENMYFLTQEIHSGKNC